MPATVRIPAKRSKYGSKITEYNGRKYHSAAEAKQAAELGLLIKAGVINDWTAQEPLRIDVNGHYICTAIIDFWVEPVHGKPYYIEVKGHETAVYKLKLKLLKACYPDIDLRIVRA
jgi:hypothetical protein